MAKKPKTLTAVLPGMAAKIEMMGLDWLVPYERPLGKTA